MEEFIKSAADTIGTTPEYLSVGIGVGAVLLGVYYLFYTIFIRGNRDAKRLNDAIDRGDHDEVRRMTGRKPYGTNDSGTQD